MSITPYLGQAVTYQGSAAIVSSSKVGKVDLLVFGLDAENPGVATLVRGIDPATLSANSSDQANATALATLKTTASGLSLAGGNSATGAQINTCISAILAALSAV